MALAPGERVKYLNEQGGGIVSRILPGKLVEVLDDGGIHLVFPISELVGQIALPPDERAIASRWKGRDANAPASRIKSARFDMKDYLLTSKPKWNSKNKDFIEVDLHLEEILEHPGRLHDGEKLGVQLHHAARALEQAREWRLPRIIFIHGIGEGILKRELRQWLAGLNDVEFRDADYKIYGMGATEVVLRGLYSK